MIVVALVLIFFPVWVMSFFSADPEVILNVIQSLRILSYGFIFYAIGSVVIQAYNGAGDTMTPTWINLAVFWIIQIPLAWNLANRLAWGPEGVYWSVFVADMSMSLIGVYFFIKGSWKTRTV